MIKTSRTIKPRDILDWAALLGPFDIDLMAGDVQGEATTKGLWLAPQNKLVDDAV